MAEPKAYIFWDNSNIYISAQQAAGFKEPHASRFDVRVHFENLHRLALAGRSPGQAIAVGSVPPDQHRLWTRFCQDTNIKLELFERGASSGTEQGVDQCLQTHMLRALADETEPQIAVLLTGDGRGFEDGVGFHADLKRMRDRGWGIEVLSWERSCKRNLKEWADNEGVFVSLDAYYESVTFLEGTRLAKTVSLVNRPKASILNSSESGDDREGLEAEVKALKKQLNIERYNKKLVRKAAATGKKGRKKKMQ